MLRPPPPPTLFPYTTIFRSADPPPVVGMEAFLPPASRRLHVLGAIPEHGGHVLVHPHAVRLEVPVPHDVVRRSTEELEPLLAPPKALLRPGAFGHVERHPNRPEDRAFLGPERLHVHVIGSALPLHLGRDALAEERAAVGDDRLDVVVVDVEVLVHREAPLLR